MSNWQQYINNTKNQSPQTLLVSALKFAKGKEAALDLGAGALNDSKYLQKVGFKKIYAVDTEESLELIKELDNKVFSFQKVAIEDYIFPLNFFDLVNVQFVLFFVRRDKMTRVINDIKKTLKPGGIFVGQFLGLNDSWSNNPAVCAYLRVDVEEFFSGLEIIYFQEEEKDGLTAMNQSKHWHIFHFIVRKSKD